jgi:hypothetical protein
LIKIENSEKEGRRAKHPPSEGNTELNKLKNYFIVPSGFKNDDCCYLVFQGCIIIFSRFYY